jgi:lipopolysaccharide biosynthesis glycosyltransferase
MQAIDQGFDEVIWLDSDIIVNRDMLPIFAQLKSDTLVATEDSLGDQRDDPNALRAHLWGFSGGRVLPFVLNSSVLRITKDHYPLMERWWNLLQSDTYQDFQKRGWKQRPVHMRSDQDVLTALLTSKEFSEIPLHVLRRGKHILQFNGVYGYTLAERIGNLLGNGPIFIHSFGGKPWSDRWLNPARGLRDYINKIYLDLSPYTLAGMTFRNEMDCDTEWMEPHYLLSRILRILTIKGYPELVGLPIAAFMDLARILKACKSFSPGDLRRFRLCN